MRLIDANMARADFNVWFRGSPHAATANYILDKQPTVDAVPVVRCKDCKHFIRTLENETYCNCVGGLTEPEEHDYCSYGERKEGEKT